MPTFSIIMPVYNAERHLAQALDSACGQTFADIEIVCVDDGSTDGSRAILSKRAADDSRMRVVDKENGGPSSARNAGIAAAKGDYLLFLDSDDALAPNACERIACELEGAAYDAVVFGWDYDPAGQADRFVREHAELRDGRYGSFEPELVFDEMTNPYLRLAVRREALAASGVRFDEELRVGEDCQFLFALYPRIGSVRLIADKLYRYRLPRPGSIMAEYKNDVANLCISDLNMTISIFADWRKGEFLCPYASRLIAWFVRGQLYTILRLPADERTQFIALVRQLWLAYFSENELAALELDAPTKHLVDIVVSASADGTLAIEENELSKALFAWRIHEYGAADLAVTSVERVRSKLEAGTRLLPMGNDDAGEQAGEANWPESLPSREELARAAAEEPIVSVIMPIYNVERFLDQALYSAQRQTLREIEIICVNDGSTDGSLSILRAHAARDPRVRIIDKENGGYGAACNRGMSEARGAWIAILEPDDWIEEDMYRRMTSFAAMFPEPIDIVKTPYWRVWLPDTDGQRTVNCSYRGRIKPHGQPFTLTDPGALHLIIHHPSIWSALYARDFIERNEIRFLEIPGAGWTDNPFLAETLVRANAIVYLDKPFYHYREETPEKTENFGRNSWRISIDRWHDMMDVYERLGVTDEGIRRAHIRRGFTYLGLILEYHDIADPEIRQSALSLFERMDDELVFSEPNISPGSKQLYAEVKGVAAPDVSAVSYALEVVKGGLYNLANTGPAMTFDTLKTFVGAHAKREGK